MANTRKNSKAKVIEAQVEAQVETVVETKVETPTNIFNIYTMKEALISKYNDGKTGALTKDDAAIYGVSEVNFVSWTTECEALYELAVAYNNAKDSNPAEIPACYKALWNGVNKLFNTFAAEELGVNFTEKDIERITVAAEQVRQDGVFYGEENEKCFGNKHQLLADAKSSAFRKYIEWYFPWKLGGSNRMSKNRAEQLDTLKKQLAPAKKLRNANKLLNESIQTYDVIISAVPDGDVKTTYTVKIKEAKKQIKENEAKIAEIEKLARDFAKTNL